MTSSASALSAQLSGADVLRVSTVLQTCADQLAVLGNIMPGGHRSRPRAETVCVVMEQHNAAEHRLKTTTKGQAEGAEVSEAMQELHRSFRELSCTQDTSLFQSRDNLAKVQRDRNFVEQVITGVLAEILEKGTFHRLLQAVEEEKEGKAHMQDIIIREEGSRLKIKALQKELVGICKEKTLELKRCEEMTAHLKHQLQEMKVNTSLEKKYVRSSTEQLVYQGQKLNNRMEKDLEEELRKLLKDKLKEETKVHMEMESFLKNRQTGDIKEDRTLLEGVIGNLLPSTPMSLDEKLEYWMERYESDMKDKQQELTTLKLKKSNNLAQLKNLATKYRESEQVIIEDRLEKRNLRKQLEKEQLERDSAIKIQSWWRGTLVRKGLGSKKKGKKPKMKEGKKGKGKKK